MNSEFAEHDRPATFSVSEMVSDVKIASISGFQAVTVADGKEVGSCVDVPVRPAEDRRTGTRFMEARL
jgi:hypothetical protein